jgi:hypothetical protein
MDEYKQWGKALPKLLGERDFVDALVEAIKESSKHGVPDMLDCIRTAFGACAEEVLHFFWDGTTPLSCSGSTWLHAVGDVCLCTSTDWEESGPYESIREALNTADSFQTEANDPGLHSRHLSEKELLSLARCLCPEECRVRINGDEYGWKDGKLVPVDELEEEVEEEEPEDEEDETEEVEADEDDEQEGDEQKSQQGS